MIEKILKTKEGPLFDFRRFACPDDELSYLFDEWVDYYHMKYSICRAIAPKNILEIGVRYGYSAVSFLSASQEAAYLGIDNDTDTYGGSKGAIGWARKTTAPFRAEFLKADTQEMTTLPGRFYDLIHIDGQQDGDGTYHDLALAMEKGRYILVDGFFWSRENMLSSTLFMEKYKDLIEYSLIIPGYGGELLIKTDERAGRLLGDKNKNNRALSSYYDVDYYLKDCGGYEQFIKNNGRELDDRLRLVYCLADPEEGQKVLDIGCGRGELSFALARAGADVTGMDYSAQAVNIARTTFSPAGDNPGLRYIHGNVADSEFDTLFDTVIAADFVEHIEKKELEEVLLKVSRILKDDGVLIIHTSPNKLNYTHDYKQKRRRARRLGLYLPDNPRTFYEDLMHINEQTPATLKRTLKRYFDNVLTWVPGHGPAGSLERGFPRRGWAEAASIFSIASKAGIDTDRIISLLTQERLDAGAVDIEITSDAGQLQMRPGETKEITVTLENRSREKIVSLPPFPVNISYHWYNQRDNSMEVFDGRRAAIRLPLRPKQKRDFHIDVAAPGKKGPYQLQITLVQEFNFWFESFSKDLPLVIAVDVK